MNQNMGRLIRYILIIQKLSGKRKYIPADELISYLNLQMELRGYEVGLSIRTLQRDIAEIGSMFEIEIKIVAEMVTLLSRETKMRIFTMKNCFLILIY